MKDKIDNQLLQYLPEIFQQDTTRDFLLAFEKILLGRQDDEATIKEIDKDPQLANQQGLEQILDHLARYFVPGTNPSDSTTPDEFLPWLSQWVALSLRWDITRDANTNNDIRRRFIAEMVQLYRYRGTKKSMQKLLAIFSQADEKDVHIDDEIDDKPYFFKILLPLEELKDSDHEKEFERRMELAHSVIRLEKPAHTYYQLIPNIITFRIGQRQEPPPTPSGVQLPTAYKVIVGKNTRLGFARRKKNIEGDELS
ncbi:MAG TPA: phage tail protein [Nitrosomonas sp.]|nr:phage tail protein [Nitrosomonas sp.]